MAWVAENDFNGLTNGDLAGQGGGTGWSGNWANAATELVNITGAVTYEGAKSVDTNTNAGVTSYTRDLTSAVSGDGNIVYLAMYRTGISAAGDHAFIFRNIIGGSRCSIKLSGNGNIELAGSTTVTLLTTYAFSTWYAFKVTLNVTAGTATAAYSTVAFGGTGPWSSESSAITMANSGNIDRVNINDDTEAGANYLDYISGTAPFTVASTNIKTVNGLAYGSVKTVNGLAVASVKTINGLA